MALIKTYNLDAKEVGEVSIDDKLIKTDANLQMIKDYIVAIRANARQWSANTKTRAEVCHSGQKPHPQKGTGRARQGYLGAPQYKGGGRVHSPRPKFDQHVRINKKERRAAIRHLLAEKVGSNNVYVLRYNPLKKPKTKAVQAFINGLNLVNKRVTFLTEVDQTSGALTEKYAMFVKSMRNIPKLEFMPLLQLSGYDIAKAGNLVIFEPAVNDFITLLGGEVK